MSDEAHIPVLLDALKDIRAEMRHQRTLMLEAIDQGRTVERSMDAQLLGLDQRIRELKEELERTFKSELMMLAASLEPGGPGG